MIVGDIALVEFSEQFHWGPDMLGNVIIVSRRSREEVAVKAANGKCHLAWQKVNEEELKTLERLRLWGMAEVAAGWLPMPWDKKYNDEEWTRFLANIPRPVIGPALVERASEERPRFVPPENGHTDLTMVQLDQTPRREGQIAT